MKRHMALFVLIDSFSISVQYPYNKTVPQLFYLYEKTREGVLRISLEFAHCLNALHSRKDILAEN